MARRGKEYSNGSRRTSGTSLGLAYGPVKPLGEEPSRSPPKKSSRGRELAYHRPITFVVLRISWSRSSPPTARDVDKNRTANGVELHGVELVATSPPRNAQHGRRGRRPSRARTAEPPAPPISSSDEGTARHQATGILTVKVVPTPARLKKKTRRPDRNHHRWPSANRFGEREPRPCRRRSGPRGAGVELLERAVRGLTEKRLCRWPDPVSFTADRQPGLQSRVGAGCATILWWPVAGLVYTLVNLETAKPRF